MKNFTRAHIKRWLCFQALAGLMVVIAFSAFNIRLGVSSGLGSLTILTANAYQGLRVALTKQEYDPVELLKNFYKGLLGKFFILAVFVVLCAKFLNLTWWAFIVGIVGAQLGGAFLLMITKGRK